MLKRSPRPPISEIVLCPILLNQSTSSLVLLHMIYNLSNDYQMHKLAIIYSQLCEALNTWRSGELQVEAVGLSLTHP